MPKVYCCQNKGYDFSPAKVYGEIIVLFDGEVPEFFNVTALTHIIKTKLADMQKEDYLILVGNVLPSAIATSIAMENFGMVNILLFDAKNLTYVPRLLARHHLYMERK
jgi:hypothetical protein